MKGASFDEDHGCPYRANAVVEVIFEVYMENEGKAKMEQFTRQNVVTHIKVIIIIQCYENP